MLYRTLKKITIVAGPNQLEINNAMSYAFKRDNFLHVNFTDETGVEYVAKITGQHYLDNIGSVCKLYGIIMEKRYYRRPEDLIQQSNENFEGTYYPNTRKGIFEVQEFTADGKSMEDILREKAAQNT